MTWPSQSIYIPRKPNSLVLYELVDDHSLVESPSRWFQRTHARWIENADILVATAGRLVDQVHQLRPDILLSPNGVDPEIWRKGKDEDIPSDLLEIRKATNIVLYCGAIARWFNWELWKAAAGAFPEWAFVLIGFPFEMEERDIDEKMTGFHNMHYLGPKLHSELPRYLAHSDIATIPFKLTPLTHACSPIKLFEYMAAGKPIVATSMEEILNYKSVIFADTPHDFIQALMNAARLKKNPEYLETMRQEAEANTWAIRARIIRDAIVATLMRNKNELLVHELQYARDDNSN